jgi:hypothetical protein
VLIVSITWSKHTHTHVLGWYFKLDFNDKILEDKQFDTLPITYRQSSHFGSSFTHDVIKKASHTCANPLHRPDYLLWAGELIQIIYHACERLLSIKILLMLNVSYPHWGLIFRFRSRRVVFPKQSRMTMLTVEADHHRQKRDQNS